MAEVHGGPGRIMVDKEESSLEICEPITVKRRILLENQEEIGLMMSLEAVKRIALTLLAVMKKMPQPQRKGLPLGRADKRR